VSTRHEICTERKTGAPARPVIRSLNWTFGLQYIEGTQSRPTQNLGQVQVHSTRSKRKRRSLSLSKRLRHQKLSSGVWVFRAGKVRQGDPRFSIILSSSCTHPCTLSRVLCRLYDQIAPIFSHSKFAVRGLVPVIFPLGPARYHAVSLSPRFRPQRR